MDSRKCPDFRGTNKVTNSLIVWFSVQQILAKSIPYKNAFAMQHVLTTTWLNSKHLQCQT